MGAISDHFKNKRQVRRENINLPRGQKCRDGGFTKIDR